MEAQNNGVNAPTLSEAEVKVCEMLVRGYAEKEIANRLSLSKFTINNHLRNIREKNGLSKNTEIIMLYIAYTRKKKFSIKNLRELGLSAVMILVTVCQHTSINL